MFDRVRPVILAVGLMLSLVSGASAQTFTDENRAAAAEMMRINPAVFTTMESALAWGVRYYGWGQPPVITIDCSRVNPYSPQAERDACPEQFVPLPALPGCEQVNAYTQPELALECTKRANANNPPKPIVKDFKLGVVHSRPYSESRMIVIGRVLDIDGKNIIVAQRVFPKDDTYGTVFTFAETDYEANYWWAVK